MITWYFDLVSPYAYLALAARHPVRVRPVVLGAILDHGKDSDGILTHRRCRAGLAQQATAASDEGVH